MPKRIRQLDVATDSQLEQEVQRVINDNAEPDYGEECYYASDVLEDLFYGGCNSGIIGEMIYTSDCVAFYDRHRTEINLLLYEAIENSGLRPDQIFPTWDEEDPLALEYHNQNVLAWFGFEETARILADRAGMET